MSTAIVMEPNPLQRALSDYTEMEVRLLDAEQKIVDLSIENGSLLAEVGMLREQLLSATDNVIRLQAVASTLSGELLAIKDVIDGSVRRALESGIKAQAADKQVRTDVEEAIQKAMSGDGAKEPEPPKFSPAPPQAVGAALGAVDWGLPQGRAS